MPDTTGCNHTWEPTGIGWTAVGRKWRQEGEAMYCPACRNFGKRPSRFLDGDFYKTQDEAARANADDRAQHRTERLAWQREHYPEHVPAERATTKEAPSCTIATSTMPTGS